MPQSDLIVPTNDRGGQRAWFHYITVSWPGNASTQGFQFALPFRADLTDVIFSLETAGVEAGTDTVQVQDDGTNLLSTTAGIAQDAADPSTVRVGGGAATGLTHPVLAAAASDIAENSIITVDYTESGKTTVATDAFVVLEFRVQQDFNPEVG